eukprot:CAMPEP_0116832206 /NCGR_PEP_ID=MMETSP0418-20121206/5766_1 /TAXON_ID=1158023 /ORGANISM="Astrosyne radiata, Strain 13vi08-1A" /LENGTH=62 /DNA_ID=CAMNT_0004461547 /DNA_START=1 /DNA_END=189 /DNA_ORIENTATION=-
MQRLGSKSQAVQPGGAQRAKGGAATASQESLLWLVEQAPPRVLQKKTPVLGSWNLFCHVPDD